MPEEPQPQALRVPEQPAQPVSPPQVLPFRLQAPPREPQVSAAQPQVPQPPEVQQPGAYAPLSPPRPSLLFPIWRLLPPLLPRPLLPGDVCALSPPHPQEWSSSASSFP